MLKTQLLIGSIAAIALAASSADADVPAGRPGAAVPREEPPAAAGPATAKVQIVNLEVLSQGFVPENTQVKVGRPVKLIVTRRVERTCATEIVIRDYDISKVLPLGVPVEIALTPKKPGLIRFACAMDMVTGALVAE